MRCTTCDFQLPEGVVFCPNCGARVAAASPSFQIPSVATTAAPGYGAPPQPIYHPSPVGIPHGTLPHAIYPAAPPASNSAVVSLVFGILAWTVLPVVGMIVAIVAGHMARREVVFSGGQIGGGGMATAGLVLGYTQLLLFVVGGCMFMLMLGGFGILAGL
jgi:hypothetical protein